jgi:hypothetical protein
MSGNPQGEVEKIDLEESGFFVMKVYELSSLPESYPSLLSQIRDLYVSVPLFLPSASTDFLNCPRILLSLLRYFCLLTCLGKNLLQNIS